MGLQNINQYMSGAVVIPDDVVSQSPSDQLIELAGSRGYNIALLAAKLQLTKFNLFAQGSRYVFDFDEDYIAEMPNGKLDFQHDGEAWDVRVGSLMFVEYARTVRMLLAPSDA